MFPEYITSRPTVDRPTMFLVHLLGLGQGDAKSLNCKFNRTPSCHTEAFTPPTATGYL